MGGYVLLILAAIAALSHANGLALGLLMLYAVCGPHKVGFCLIVAILTVSTGSLGWGVFWMAMHAINARREDKAAPPPSFKA